MSLSTFLNGREPSRLRGLQFLSLSDVGLILSPTSVSDAGGGASTTWGTAGTAACRVDPLGSAADGRLTGGQIDERSTHVVTAPTGTGVSTSDRVSIAGRGTFEVTALRETTAGPVEMFEVLQVL